MNPCLWHVEERGEKLQVLFGRTCAGPRASTMKRGQSFLARYGYLEDAQRLADLFAFLSRAVCDIAISANPRSRSHAAGT